MLSEICYDLSIVINIFQESPLYMSGPSIGMACLRRVQQKKARKTVRLLTGLIYQFVVQQLSMATSIGLMVISVNLFINKAAHLKQRLH